MWMSCRGNRLFDSQASFQEFKNAVRALPSMRASRTNEQASVPWRETRGTKSRGKNSREHLNAPRTPRRHNVFTASRSANDAVRREPGSRNGGFRGVIPRRKFFHERIPGKRLTVLPCTERNYFCSCRRRSFPTMIPVAPSAVCRNWLPSPDSSAFQMFPPGNKSRRKRNFSPRGPSLSALKFKVSKKYWIHPLSASLIHSIVRSSSPARTAPD